MKGFSKMKGLLLLCAATLLNFSCGCGSEPVPSASEATLTVSPAAVNATFEAQTVTLTVNATGDWGVAAADKDWCTVSPSGGIKGTSEVKLALATNRTGKERENTITFRYGSKTLEVPVKQGFSEEDLPPDPGEIVVPDGYHLVWHDEFDEGPLLDPAHWTQVQDGSLHIHCFKEGGKIYSGRVYAHVGTGWQYGWFEARINLPKGKGTWPAFWMMPVGNDWNTNPWPMCGEIDIMEEVGCVPNEVSSSIHTQDYNHTKNTQKTHAMTIAKAEGEYHVYALEWTEDAITTYVDGKVQLAVKKSVLGSGHNQWPFHYAFYPILNLAWGGDWGGMNGVDESALPVTMSVDYIRVFQK